MQPELAKLLKLRATLYTMSTIAMLLTSDPTNEELHLLYEAGRKRLRKILKESLSPIEGEKL